MAEALFPLGRTVITPGALRTLERLNVSPMDLYTRHVSGDWRDMTGEDQVSNSRAVTHGGRVFSSYHVGNPETKVWVITEADRSVSTILLPSEY